MADRNKELVGVSDNNVTRNRKRKLDRWTGTVPGRWDFNHLLRETVLNPISQSDKLGDERTFNQSIDKGAALTAESFTLLFIIVRAVSIRSSKQRKPSLV